MKRVTTFFIIFAAGVFFYLGSQTKGDAMENKPEKSEEQVFTGRCHCGEITYEVKGKIVKCSTCKCRGCQKASGTLEVGFVTVLRNDFKLTKGKPTEFHADSDAQCDKHGNWFFCEKCGGHLYWKAAKGDELDLFAGSLDDTSLFVPKKGDGE